METAPTTSQLKVTVVPGRPQLVETSNLTISGSSSGKGGATSLEALSVEAGCSSGSGSGSGSAGPVSSSPPAVSSSPPDSSASSDSPDSLGCTTGCSTVGGGSVGVLCSE